MGAFIDTLTPYLFYIRIAKEFFLVLSMFLIGWAVYNVPYEAITQSVRRNNAERMERLRTQMAQAKFNTFNYDMIQTFILSRGLVYQTKGRIDALKYTMIKLCTAIVIAIFSMQFSVLLGIPFLVIGFFLPDLIVSESDNQDNSNMAVDIKNIYDSLRIQTKAGVFITEALSECYMVVKNRRLKTALLQLSSEIAAQSDIIMAVEEFNNKFNNQYIDEFCIIMKQSIESGRTVKLLEDISEQLTDMQTAINIKEKEKLQRRIMFAQVMLYAGILAICVVAVGMQLSGTLGAF